MKYSAHFQEEYLSVNGTQTYLLTFPAPPDRPVLLFVHGGPGCSESGFAYFYHTLLGDACTLVFYDQRGAGRTLHRSPDAPLSIVWMLQDLDKIVRLLHIRYPGAPLLLMGHSWGTVLGALYALRHPQQLSYYIGVSQVVSLTEGERFSAGVLRRVLARHGTPQACARLESFEPYPPAHWDPVSVRHYLTVARLRNQYGLREAHPVSMAPLIRRSPTFCPALDLPLLLAGNRKSLPLLCACMNAFHLSRFPCRWHVPALFIQGERDFITPLPPVHAYVSRMQAPQKALTVMKGAGHGPMFDDPERFARLVRAPLEQLENEV